MKEPTMDTEQRSLLDKEVYTPLGKGRVVYELANGTCLVEFDYGGGQVFMRGQLFLAERTGRQRRELVA
jgi:hypothetical protein